MLPVVVEVDLGRVSGPEEIQSPVLLLEGPTSLCLLQPKILEAQEQHFTFDRVLGPDAAQEAEQELLLRVQSVLASVSQGYSIALLLRGRESEAPRLVLQLLQVLFETALPLHRSDGVLSTLSLVQVSHGGKARDLLSPAMEELSVLDVAPLGLVVEDASEVEVSDSTAASELYLQAVGGDSRTRSLLTLTISCPGPDLPDSPGTQGMWLGALRILQLPKTPDCPLLRVLAGEVLGEEMEGSLPWIVSQLLEGNNYGGLLLRLDPQGSSLSLLQAALQGASERRVQGKQVRPTLWNAVEETRARRAGLKILRLGLLGDTLTNSRLSQLRRALQELQIVKAWSQCPRSLIPKGARAEAVQHQESQDQGKPLKYSKQGRQHCSHLSAAGRTVSPGPGLHQKHSVRDSEEQVPDVVLQFFLAQARRQKLREQNQIWIQEELKHLEQMTSEQVKGLVAGEEVFRAWQALWEERAMTTEHRHRSLLIDILQDNVDLASQNQELQARNQELQPQQHVG